jgi:uncharacterized membrane protein YhhN
MDFSQKMNNTLRLALVIVFSIVIIEMIWLGAHGHGVITYFAAAACMAAITRVTWLKTN